MIKKDAHVAKFDDFSQIVTLIDILSLLKSKHTKEPPVRAHQTLTFALFCVLIAEISKKMGTKRAYKVSMIGGCVFSGPPCNKMRVFGNF